MSGPLGASTSLSGKYAEAAAYSARQAWSIQVDARTTPPEQRDELEHHYRLYCTAAVYYSVLFLESAIHELFAAVAVDSPRLARDFSDEQRARLTEYWDRHGRSFRPDRSPPLVDRYNDALQISENETFAPESGPALGVRSLIAFSDSFGENAMILEEERIQTEPFDLEAELVEAGFSLNPFREDAPFPDLYLSHGSAEWAINTAVAFHSEFCSRMRIRNELDSPIVSLGTRDKRASD